MNKIYFFILFIIVSIQIQAQTQLFFDDFESGSGNWTLVSGDNGGCTSWCSFDFVVTNDYLGGSYWYGFITILDTPSQAGSGISLENGHYLHVNDAGNNLLINPPNWNANYFAGSGQSVFTEMSSAIVTTGYTGVEFSFYWLDDGGTGQAYYSTDGGTTWAAVGGAMNGSTSWSQVTLTNVNFDNQADLRFGFKFTDNATQADPPLSIDDVKVVGTPAGGCATTTTFNGFTWDNGAPDNTKKAIISGNFNSTNTGSTVSFTCCELEVTTAGTLTINNGHYVEIEGDLVNAGTITVQNQGALVQTDNTSTCTGAGTYSVHKSTTPYLEYDYTYWSSPITNESIESVFATNPVNYIFRMETVNFSDMNSGNNYPQITAGADTFDDTGDDWQLMGQSSTLIPGVGYITMGESSVSYPHTQNVIFSNTAPVIASAFNNGDITVPVTLDNYNATSQTGYDTYNTNANLIGNPYPSAIDIHQLYTDNNTILDGTFYFWTHDTAISATTPGPNALNFTTADYAIASTDGTILSVVQTSPNGTNVPSTIASCQGFFVNVNTAGNVVFNNSMRVTGSNNTFMRPTTTNLDRVWLNLTDETDLFRQILVSFHDNATDTYQDGQDSQRLENGNDADFYSVIDGDQRRFAIQNLATFNDTKIVKLGVEIVEQGNYTISIDNVIGIFDTTQNIYLYDYQTNILHNLSNSSYIFTSNIIDNQEDRFELRFRTGALSVNNPILDSIEIYPNPSNGKFYINWDNAHNLDITLYNISGKKISENEFTYQDNKYILDLNNYTKGIYFVKLHSDSQTITKKLILK